MGQFLAVLAIIAGSLVGAVVVIVLSFKAAFVASDWVEEKTDRPWLGFMTYGVVLAFVVGLTITVVMFMNGGPLR